MKKAIVYVSKNIVIRKHKNGYRIFDISNNKHVVTTFTKTAALAIAKIVAERGNSNNIKDIIVLDNKYVNTIWTHYLQKELLKLAKI